MGRSIRFRNSSWVTDVTYTEGKGFTGNDAIVVNHLNAQAADGEVDTCEEAVDVVAAEFPNVESGSVEEGE